mgnify:CR=1 FL=1
MEKPAVTDVPLNELLRRRWSPRAFEPRPVEKEVLRRIFEAARWAPSAYNEQPWRFLLASRDQEPTFSLLLGCLVEQNQVWAANAGALAVGDTRKFFTHNEKPNRHAHHDLGLAVAQLTLQAVAEGIFVHPMAGFSLERVRQVWSVPEIYEPLVALALGYPGDPDTLGEDLRQREYAPRERRSLEELVFSGAWNDPFWK